MMLLSQCFFCAAPALLIGGLYHLQFEQRSDYLGHFAAGYGGTLGALAVLFALLPARSMQRSSMWICIGSIVCIGLGTIAEATVFRLAKFDEVDYCNQNLGAILAGFVMLNIVSNDKPSDAVLSIAIALAAAWLAIGVYFAAT